MKYSCSKCIFADMVEGTQVGCDIDRLNVVGISGDFETLESKDYFYIENFCMGFRPKEWISDRDIQDPKVEVIEEMKDHCPVGYVIDFNKDLEGLRNTIKSLESPKYVIVLNRYEEYQPEVFEILEEANHPFYHTLLLSDQNKYEKMDMAFKNCKNGWFVYVTSGHIFASDFYDRIFDAFINKGRKIFCISDENHEKVVIFSKIYKHLNGSLVIASEDNDVNSLNFFERLIKSTDKNPIISWEEFFE